nr:hemopexin repeat-containing protein [Actinoplanes ianthinogenes]
MYHDDAVDAAFVGADGRTYVFRGDQFVTYTGSRYAGVLADQGPRPVAEHWGGLTSVALAYLSRGVTYLFEPPGADGTTRYVSYSGPDYTTPDAGGPQPAGPEFWSIPEAYVVAGFRMPDAVLTSGDTQLVVTGGRFLQHDPATGTWSYPRPLERMWRGLGEAEGLRTAFTGADGAAYFFFADGFTRYAAGVAEPRRAIREYWGLTRNNFLGGGDDVVDAAVVAGEHTFLFSGDQYVRYSTADCRYADDGYPKAIVGNLRTEAGFTGLPVAFDDEVAQRFADGSRSMIDAAVAGGRTVYLFTGRTCHSVDTAATAEYDIDRLGRIRNTIAERQRVDAALVQGRHTYLFSGDQVVRYTGGEYGLVDDGYPKPIADFEPAALPAAFQDGVDAAFQAPDGALHFFTGRTWFSGGTAAPVAGRWGVVDSEFGAGRPIDAAFVTAGGELYAFRGGQYLRYSRGPETADEGYPLRIAGRWGEQTTFDGGFRLHGRVYLTAGEQFVRYQDDDFDPAHPVRPALLRHRFSDGADYRIDDVRAIERFTALLRGRGLDGFLLPGLDPVTDPYQRVADAFGWDAGELKWCRRNSRFLTGGAADEERFELEFLLAAAGLFALADRFGAGPSRVFADVWTPLFDRDALDLDRACGSLNELLAAKAGAGWPVLARQIHDELNLARRSALVPAVLAELGLTDSRDLFDRFLIDVDMGSRGMTSRVREAIAAVQLYLHRYLLGLEDGDGGAAAAEAFRQKIKDWWEWMHDYRVWEANRKVFLYPENYLRPELRTDKTPAFAQLESDLLQGEITPAAVEKAYKRYLDEYAEVSRLTIAGGYVYTKDQDPAGPRRLVVFGRTRTDPRRYYYRRAEFGSREKLSAQWEPWSPVDLRIDADLVHPVHAFGRVFVFWAVSEPVGEDDPSTAVVTAHTEGDKQTVSAQAKKERVKIFYSFENLNKEWMPAQELGTGAGENGTITGITLLVRPQMTGDRMSIRVSCSYTATAAGATGRRAAVLFDLNPELYADALPEVTAAKDPAAKALEIADDLESSVNAAATTERVSQIFQDPVNPADVVRFHTPAGAESWPWFSVDVKGGSFLCRPVTAPEPENAPFVAFAEAGTERVPKSWTRVDAAVELPDGTRYFFRNSDRQFLSIAPDGTATDPSGYATRWGLIPTMLPESTDIDAVLTRGNQTFVFYGAQYVRSTGTPFGQIDPGYPQPIGAVPEDRLPKLDRIDVAFTDAKKNEYFYHHTDESVIISTADGIGKPIPIKTQREQLGLPADFGKIVTIMTTDKATYVIGGTQYAKFPLPTSASDKQWWETTSLSLGTLSGNQEGIPTDFVISEAHWHAGTAYFFDNKKRTYLAVTGTSRVTRPYHVTTDLPDRLAIDAAWVAGGKLYLSASGGTVRELYRYTLNGSAIGRFVDDTYPQKLPRGVSGVFQRDDQMYVFSANRYTRVPVTQEPTTLPVSQLITGAWAEMPRPGTPFDGVLDSKTGLYLFTGAGFHRHSTTLTVRRPYELSSLPFELIRLTSGTASQLSRRLLSGGVPALLDLATQQTDEVLVSTSETATDAVRVRSGMVDPGRLPTGSHLDFRSANGMYYWEVFFHAPLLIAQALNNGQRFADARKWYQYVFDPTNLRSYWRFLPFLTTDPPALAADLTVALAAAVEAGLPVADRLAPALTTVITALRDVAPAVLGNREPAGDVELGGYTVLTTAANHAAVAAALAGLNPATPAQREIVGMLTEHSLIAADLEKVFGALGDHENLLEAYRDRPFDPHAIAELRPAAYRRAVVMGYVDNLLDWADLLFRQYTPESVDQARMLYVFAYDLLGAPPERLGTRLLPRAETYADLDLADLDLVGYLTGGGDLLAGAGSVHAGVADRYFAIPENALFQEYWTRVEDRLHKIRESLTILGVAAPLPLFAPPIDPMALVQAAAAGAAPDTVVADQAVAPPAYRFATMFRRAQELAEKVAQYGGELLSVLERGSAEELSLLQNRQEQAIQAMTVALKQSEIEIAEANVRELLAGQAGAAARVAHYQRLIDDGMSALERGQIEMMSKAAELHMDSGWLQVGAAIAYALPQIKIGVFNFGTEAGGINVGEALNTTGQVLSAFGEAYSMVGETLGVQAQFQRTAQDWDLQLATARNDGEQLVHRIAAAGEQVAVARREADLQAQEIAHSKAVGAFLTDKFPSAQLYGWMAGRASGLYFQLYHLAYETAKAAERAYQFENGVSDSFIRPVYWDNRRNGLLAGASLGVDLERLGKAQLDGGARGLEITKQISLLDLDPIAMLRLRQSGNCEFALTEALFDEDFPGHFKRQIRTVTVTFLDQEGQPLGLNGTLTQLGHKTVLAADPRAVKHLLSPTGAAPESIRADWRASQQIALSQPDGGRDNNGLFELRFDDERYLPFEGTGAVSTWRLDRTMFHGGELYDVLVTVKYTAEHGGEAFANAVRGMQRPRPAARFFDVAREFPEAWEQFLNGADRLVLPLTTDLFPGMASRQIGGALAAYELADGGSAELVLGGDPALTLAPAKLLPTPGLSVSDDGSKTWEFTVDGDRSALADVGLVLTYQARMA